MQGEDNKKEIQGYKTKITWEKEVRPNPVVEKGVRNVMSKLLGINRPINLNVRYDPITSEEIHKMVGATTEFTVRYYKQVFLFPLGKRAYIEESAITFEGFLDNLRSAGTKENEEPQMTMEIHPTTKEK